VYIPFKERRKRVATYKIIGNRFEKEYSNISACKHGKIDRTKLTC